MQIQMQDADANNNKQSSKGQGLSQRKCRWRAGVATQWSTCFEQIGDAKATTKVTAPSVRASMHAFIHSLAKVKSQSTTQTTGSNGMEWIGEQLQQCICSV